MAGAIRPNITMQLNPTHSIDSSWQEQLNQLDSKDNAFMLDAFSLLSEVEPNLLKSKHQAIRAISSLIARIDELLSKQLDNIYQDNDFQSLEANWRGLHSIATLPVNSQKTRLKLLDMSWEEVSSDLNQAYSIKSSELFNKIGNQELNTLGGHPFGCIAFTKPISVEMDFDADYDDIFTLELISKLGELTLCPMLLSPSEEFFVHSGADWLSDVSRIEKIINGPDYAAWQSLRAKTSSRFIGMPFPSIKLRSKFVNKKVGFIYNEGGNGLFGSAVFPFISTIMREHHRVNWFGFLKSRWNDKYQGAVINMPNHHVGSEPMQYPECDITLFGQISTFYAQNGFIPITKSPLTDKYYFNGNNSIWQSGYSDNDKVLTQIQTTLMSCRIAHYLKVQVREMIGSFSTAAECEVFLTQWIEKFASNVSLANEETLSKYPLSFAKISINESAAMPGSYSCTLRLVPQYQFDHFSGEVVLTTELDEVA